jgi:hypothetical protein
MNKVQFEGRSQTYQTKEPATSSFLEATVKKHSINYNVTYFQLLLE